MKHIVRHLVRSFLGQEHLDSTQSVHRLALQDVLKGLVSFFLPKAFKHHSNASNLANVCVIKRKSHFCKVTLLKYCFEAIFKPIFSLKYFCSPLTEQFKHFNWCICFKRPAQSCETISIVLMVDVECSVVEQVLHDPNFSRGTEINVLYQQRPTILIHMVMTPLVVYVQLVEVATLIDISYHLVPGGHPLVGGTFNHLI